MPNHDRNRDFATILYYTAVANFAVVGLLMPLIWTVASLMGLDSHLREGRRIVFVVGQFVRQAVRNSGGHVGALAYSQCSFSEHLRFGALVAPKFPFSNDGAMLSDDTFGFL